MQQEDSRFAMDFLADARPKETITSSIFGRVSEGFFSHSFSGGVSVCSRIQILYVNALTLV